MAVRRQCNRYRTAPYGTNRREVYDKAKRFFRTGSNSDCFMIWGGDGGVWQSDFVPHYDCKLPNQVFYKWSGTRWVQAETRPA